MKKKIQVVQEKLNHLVDKKSENDEEILRLSMELDKLILEYYYSQIHDKSNSYRYSKA